jgi:hypothetical protein
VVGSTSAGMAMHTFDTLMDVLHQQEDQQFEKFD